MAKCQIDLHDNDKNADADELDREAVYAADEEINALGVLESEVDQPIPLHSYGNVCIVYTITHLAYLASSDHTWHIKYI